MRGRVIWSASYLAIVLPLRPEQVLRCAGRHGGWTPESRLEWTWISTAQRLAWQYGESGALARLRAYAAAV
jgi:hypothetical protein